MLFVWILKPPPTAQVRTEKSQYIIYQLNNLFHCLWSYDLILNKSLLTLSVWQSIKYYYDYFYYLCFIFLSTVIIHFINFCITLLLQHQIAFMFINIGLAQFFENWNMATLCMLVWSIINSHWCGIQSSVMLTTLALSHVDLFSFRLVVGHLTWFYSFS